MTDKAQVQAFYNDVRDGFDPSYEWDGALYPSNRIRMEHCLDLLASAKAHTVLDAGCGTGIILAELLSQGYDADGFDFSDVAVAVAKGRLTKLGHSPERAWIGDIEQPQGTRRYDAILVMGAFTHPLNHAKALSGLRGSIIRDGLLLVELRNDLFNLFTMNEYTLDLLQRMLPESPLKAKALDNLSHRAYRRYPVPPDSEPQKAHERFFRVPSAWRNPLTVDAEYRSGGFEVIDKLWFHWHAVPPVFEAQDRKAFRESSLALERTPHDWRGMFLASAFIVVARAL